MIIIENLEKAILFIEKYYNLKLYDYQKQMLEWMIKGYTFSVPRRNGRTMILNGYKKYLETIHGEHLSYEQAEKHITTEDIIEYKYVEKKLKEDNQEKFKQEYECEWIK